MDHRLPSLIFIATGKRLFYPLATAIPPSHKKAPSLNFSKLGAQI